MVLKEHLLMRVKGEKTRESVETLRPGDVVDFRYTNRRNGEWPWGSGPWIVEEINLARLQLTLRRPFGSLETIYLGEIEINLLAKGAQP